MGKIMSDAPKLPPLRRVVTGHDRNNVAKVIIDGPPNNSKGGASGATSTLIWSTDQTPADCAVGEDIEDRGARIIGTPPPENGSRFAVIEFPPGNPGRMHRTETIDYVVVICGELDMDIDDSTLRLNAGDALVQRATSHARAHPGPQ